MRSRSHASPMRPRTVPNQSSLLLVVTEIEFGADRYGAMVTGCVSLMSEPWMSVSTPRTKGPVCQLNPIWPPPNGPCALSVPKLPEKKDAPLNVSSTSTDWLRLKAAPPFPPPYHPVQL